MRIARQLTVIGALALSLIGGVGGAAQAAAPTPAAPHKVIRPMAARSTQVIFKNYTGLQLDRTNWSLAHGIWAQLPPEHIAPVTKATWQSESNGFATGTEGWVNYATPVGQIHVYWDNPFVGSNDYACTAPANYTCASTGGGGDNATVTFILNVAL